MNLKNLFYGRSGSFRIPSGLLLILGGLLVLNGLMGCKSRTQRAQVAFPSGMSPYGYGSQTSQQNTLLQREKMQQDGRIREIEVEGQVNAQKLQNQAMLLAVVLGILKGGASGLEEIISKFNKPGATPPGAPSAALTPVQLAKLGDIVAECKSCTSCDDEKKAFCKTILDAATSMGIE